MLRAPRPSTPGDDLAAAAAGAPRLGSSVLTAELAAFCQSGLSIVVGTRDPDGRPVAARAIGCRIDGSGRVRVLLAAASAPRVLAAICRDGAVAVTFTRPFDHRSIQLKAPRAEATTPDPGDGALAAAQGAALAATLVTAGYAPDLCAVYVAFDTLAAFDFVPTEAFVQTPGPSAGSPLAP